MKCSHLVLWMVAGSCATAALAQPDTSRPPDGGAAQRDPIAALLALERYPLVALREDLGEALVDKEKEVELVRDSIAAASEVVQSRAKDIIGRGDHGKALGCYAAKFTVSGADAVRPEHQAGVARADNLGKTFDAIVRLSNSEPRDVSDFRSATVGLAVKVMLDPARPAQDEFLLERSGAQDFVAGGLDKFVSPSISTYADLFRRRIHPVTNALQIIDQHPDAYWVFFKEPLLRFVNPSPGAAPIVLETTFSSLVPYAWGNEAVKFRFKPCREYDRRVAKFSRFDSDYQSKVVAQELESNAICYVMEIQPRPRAGSDDERAAIDKAYPLDDATVRWPEAGTAQGAPGSEFREVARVTIEQGSKAMDEQSCECLAFNPWNGLKAHQPLGSLNRARLAVYKQSELARMDKYRPPCPHDK